MRIKNNKPGRVVKIAFMLATLVLFACSSPTDLELVQTAKEYLVQTKVREATIELKNALQKNPKNAEARYLLGGINLNLGDIASAEKEFNRAADAGWPEEQARIGLARAMLARNALKKLLDETKIKSSYPVSARANLSALHALAQMGLNNQAQAQKLLRNAFELDANAMYVLKSAALIKFATGDLAGANKSMKQALASYGDVQEILLLSALMANSNDEQLKAAAAFRKVIALEPHDVVTLYGRKARLGLAKLEISKSSFDQAQTTLAPLFKQRANDPEANFIGGFLAFKQGRLDIAEKRLLSVLKVVPDNMRAQLLLGTISYEQRSYEQAAYYVARYVSAVPGDLHARKLLGQTYNKLDQYEKALAVLQPALQENSDDAELLTLVSLLQLRSGDMASGVKGLERAVKAAPDDLVLKNKLARVYIFVGDTKNAVKIINILLAKGGDKKQAQVLLITAHIKAKQYARAIKVVLGMVEEAPGDPAILSLAGNVYVTSHNNSEARRYFNRALQQSPGSLPASMYLARLEELEGHADKAEAIYKALAQANKKDISALTALVDLAVAQNRSEEVVNWLHQIGERSPQDVRSRTMLVEYYLRKKQLAKADLILKEVIKIAPADKAVLDIEAKFYIARGQYNEAISPLNKLIAQVPDSAYIRTLLADVYMKLGQQADARLQLDTVLEKRPDYVPALVLIANLELHSGHFDQALNHAVMLQKIQPDLYLGYELAGDAAMNKKEYATAKNSYQQAWQRKPSTSLVIKRSEISARAGKLAEAARPLSTWLKTHPDDVRVLQSLGVVFQNMKQNARAIKAYEKVLQVQPDNVVVLNNLAWLYSLQNNPWALELAERAYKVAPDNIGIQDTYGWVLVQQGRVDEGRHILRRVISVLPDVSEVQYHYAVALLKSGEEARAKKILGKLLENDKAFEGREDAERLLK